MRAALLVLVVLAAACRSRIATERDSELYAGLGVSGLPHVGAAVTAGQMLSKQLDKSDFAFEMRGVYQGGDDSPTQDGKFFQVQAGVRQVLSPGHRRQVYFRYGATWFRATGDPNILDRPGDYFGAYGAVGYQWRVGDRITAGPEVGVSLVNGEGGLGTEVLPHVGFGFLFDF